MGKEICPGLVISAFKGGSGKTILSLGLTATLAKKGIKIAPFKKGPDYIDAKWLGFASGTDCYNLDPYLMDKKIICASYLAHIKGADIAIVEGNRGLYDGVDELGSCSTAELAKLLKLPVILVIDCTKITRTVAALVLGCKLFDPDVKICGCVLNQVARLRHESIVTKTVERYTDIKVLGALPRLKQDPLPMRHLGVLPCEEHPKAKEVLDVISTLVSEHTDIDALINSASIDPKLTWPLDKPSLYPVAQDGYLKRVKIGVFRDAAFQFYYPENFEALKAQGAELYFLNALNVDDISFLDALYIGGGFPETQADRLIERQKLFDAIKKFADKGRPIYAECGGLMFLGKKISFKGIDYDMVGIFPWTFSVGRKPQGHGYTILEVERDSGFYKKGDIIRGHEFHYSKPIDLEEQESKDIVFTCKVKRGHGFNGKLEGALYKNVFATYTHIHALSKPCWAKRFVELAFRIRENLLNL